MTPSHFFVAPRLPLACRWGGLIAGLTVFAALVAGCGEEITDFDSLYLLISADKTPERVARLEFDLVNPAGEKLLSAGNDKLKVTLPASVDLAVAPFRVQVKPNNAWAGTLQLRILGFDAAGKAQASHNGTIVSTDKGERVVRLVVIGAKADCDADGDGVPKCSPECQPKGALCDCLDDATLDPDHGNVPKGKLASPFLKEDSCLDAGDGIDQDCDGSDLAKVDTDADGDADCVEQQKCPTVDGKPPETNPDVSTKAVDLCDGIDNNCDGKVDAGLEFVDIDGQKKSLAKGDGCGVGACKDGKVECAADKKSLVCSTAGAKKEEVCSNGTDDDCDGQLDEGCESDDLDGDGVANCKEVPSAIDPKCKSAEPQGPCKYKFAAFHAEYHPGANEPCCPAGQDCSGKDGLWDFNCDGKVTACAADDPDGDGQTAAAGDCEPNNPDVFSGAKKQKCGDGKGPCPIDGDVPCSNDKDGDQYNADVDCNDADKAINPAAAEVCNGIDDDCDGIVDDGNPGASDAVCGDKDGECGLVSGITVCKHFVAKDTTFKPDDLDCATNSPYKAAADGKTGICVGCYGDNRPSKEGCDDKDNDCDATTDEDFPYEEEGSKKALLWGQPCDGVGTCGAGTVQCGSPVKTICSTDPGGQKDESKAETCDNKDNNCNGKIDESLTLVSDSKCQKVGVCASGLKNIETVCVAGQWRCDYAKVIGTEYDKNKSCGAGDSSCQCEGLDPGKPPMCYAMKESSCDALDNDCDGQTDEDFDFSDWNKKSLKIGTACGTGACAGGKVVCEGGISTKGILTCDTLIKVSKEKCNSADDDCDGQTDELNEMPITDSTCLLTGVCSKDNVVHTCPAGKWLCNYGAVKGYEEGKEITCDGLDNDCDGQTDEDFTFKEFDGKSLKVSDGCGTGVCKDGKVVCSADKKGLTCSTLVNVAAEICDYKDNNCDGQSDETFSYTQESGKVVAMGQQCDGIGVCGVGIVECTPGKTTEATCSTDANGSKKGDTPEKCNDLDDDCDKVADEGCDLDKDGYCTAAMETATPAPKSCSKGGKDCDDDPSKNKDAGLVNPGAGEQCDGIDNNCSGATDEIFSYKEPTGASIGVGQGCGLGECALAKSKVVCLATKTGAECPGYKPSEEICDNKDNDCDGQVDEGCDKDGDKYCDVAMKVAGVPAVCPNTKVTKDGNPGDDCNDDPAKGGKAINPGAGEVCDDIDNNCALGKDEGCDDDNDDYCDGKIAIVGTPSICPKGGNDCNDDKNAINPSALEICDNIDNNCNSKTDEGCDDDGDKYCDATIAVVGSPDVCPKTIAVGGKGDDCNDAVLTINPAAAEICDDIDNNCNTSKDEGCDKDSDLYCDAKIPIVGTPQICPKGGNDCNDSLNTINPSALEICDDIDNNCNTTKDEGCDDDGDKFCDGSVAVIGTPLVCPLTKAVGGKGDDCNDDAKTGGAINPNAAEICDDLDNNCASGKDEGCDNDNDKYCDAALPVVGTPAVCPLTKAVGGKGDDCNDDPAKNGILVNPGKKESCGNGIDDQCDGKTDDEGAVNCTDLFFDSDKDGFGAGSSKCLCKPNDIANYTATAGGDCVDTDKLVFPGQKETCATTGDDNCNNSANDQDATDCKDFYLDADGDTFGAATKKCLCQSDVPSKYTAAAGTDCNDDPAKGGAAVNPSKTEICNDIDDNCAAGVDEGCDVDNDDYCTAKMTVVGKPTTCSKTDGGGSPGKAGNDCDDAKVDINPGKTEACNDIDDNCTAGTDENCDDDNDDYCDGGMVTVGTPAVCPKGGGDCNDVAVGGGKDINPAAVEICDDIDNNCVNNKDEGCDDDNDDYCDAGKIVVGKPPVCPKTDGGNSPGKAGNDCNDDKADIKPGATEVCDNIDNDCSGSTDEGCDDDNDDYCDAGKTVIGKPTTCAQTDGGASPGKAGNDCDDAKADIKPGVTEICDSVDNNCSGATDEGCDDDNDDYCDASMTVVGKPATCSKTDGGASPGKAGNDCNDMAATAFPLNPEACDDLDNNCSGATDEGCDDDTDGYCDAGFKVIGKPKVCPANADGGSAPGKAGADCDDDKSAVKPGALEICDDVDNNCSGATDEGCDDDNDDFCDKGMTVIGKPKVCPKSDGGVSPGKMGDDCLDDGLTAAKAFPGNAEVCDDIDNNCVNGIDETCDVDNDDYCDAGQTVYGTPTTCKKTNGLVTGSPGNDCKDDDKDINPGMTEICNNKDDDCKGGVDNAVKPTIADCSKMTKGVCTAAAVEGVAVCSAGVWDCKYTSIQFYECDTGACKELSCTDGKDNNCDGTIESPCGP